MTEGFDESGKIYLAPPNTPPPGTRDLLELLNFFEPVIQRDDPQVMRIGGPSYELLYRVNERANGRGHCLGKPTNWKGL